MKIFPRAQKRANIACVLAYLIFVCAIYTHVNGWIFFSVAFYGLLLATATLHLIGWVDHYRHFYNRYKQIKLDLVKERDRLNARYELDQARHMKNMREWNEIVDKARKLSGF